MPLCSSLGLCDPLFKHVRLMGEAFHSISSRFLSAGVVMHENSLFHGFTGPREGAVSALRHRVRPARNSIRKKGFKVKINPNKVSIV